MIDRKVKDKLDECWGHIHNYIGEPHTPELIAMCKNCENWCGKEHNYEECREKPCFICWLGLEYLMWETSWEGGW